MYYYGNSALPKNILVQYFVQINFLVSNRTFVLISKLGP